MSTTFQNFIAAATEKAATDLSAALLTLPEDKRGWSPSDSARTALHLVAECALNNGAVIEMIEAGEWRQPSGGQEAYFQIMQEWASGDWNALHTLLMDNTRRLAAALNAVGGEALAAEFVTPYSTGPFSGFMAYPYWNMSYHEGQINYIASLLGDSQRA